MPLIRKLIISVATTAILTSSAIAQVFPAEKENDLPELKLSASEKENLEKSTLEAYSAVLGDITQDELNDYLQKSEAVQALSAKLEKEIPNEFGGVRLLPTKEFKAEIYLKPKGKQAFFSSLTRSSEADYIVVKPTQYSLVELRDTLSRVMKALDGKKVVVTAYIDVENQDVVVSAENDELVRPMLAFLEKEKKSRVGNTSPIRIIKEKRGEKRVNSSLGGMRASQSNSFNNCTVGIAVRKGTKHGATSAGHCPDSLVMANYINGNIGVYTSLEQDYYEVPSNPIDLQWSTPNSSTDSILPYVRATTGFWKVKTYGATDVNHIICQSGAKTYAVTSEITCGRVRYTDVHGYDRENKRYDDAIQWDNAHNDGNQYIIIRPGDSGAPLWELRSQHDGVKIVGWTIIGAYPIDPDDPVEFQVGVGLKVHELTDRDFVIRGYP